MIEVVVVKENLQLEVKEILGARKVSLFSLVTEVQRMI